MNRDLFWLSGGQFVQIALHVANGYTRETTCRRQADCKAGLEFLGKMPAVHILHGDKSHDSNAIRRHVEDAGAMLNIPPKANQCWKNCFSPHLY